MGPLIVSADELDERPKIPRDVQIGTQIGSERREILPIDLWRVGFRAVVDIADSLVAEQRQINVFSIIEWDELQRIEKAFALRGIAEIRPILCIAQNVIVLRIDLVCGRSGCWRLRGNNWRLPALLDAWWRFRRSIWSSLSECHRRQHPEGDA